MFQWLRLIWGRVTLDRVIRNFLSQGPDYCKSPSQDINFTLRALRAILNPVYQYQEAQALMGSGYVSPTRSYWYLKAGRCMFREMDMSNLHDEVKNLDLRQIEEPHELLGVVLTEFSPATDSAGVLLEWLKTICPRTAQLYRLRETALERLRMRLVKHIDSPSLESYVAVSYRWPNACKDTCKDTSSGSRMRMFRYVPILLTLFGETNGRSQVSHPQSKARVVFPTSFTPIPCKALLDERQSQNEGIWIDQLCVNQNCEEEKLHTIPAMDLIYKEQD